MTIKGLSPKHFSGMGIKKTTDDALCSRACQLGIDAVQFLDFSSEEAFNKSFDEMLGSLTNRIGDAMADTTGDIRENLCVKW